MTTLRHIIITIMLMIPIFASAQSIIKEQDDTTIVTEYNDGRLWAYKQIGNIVVGMTNYEESDKYGKYYQIAIFIKNLGDSTITFYPDKIVASLYSKNGDIIGLKVYTYDKYMSRVHLEITIKKNNDGTYTHTLRDISTHNNTYINDVRIPKGQLAILEPGSTLKLGHTTFAICDTTTKIVSDDTTGAKTIPE